METTFDNLLERIDSINFEDWRTLNNLKPIATEFLKRALPNDSETAIQNIQNLNFKARPGSDFWKTSGGNPIEVWNSAIGTFRGIIQSKKESFESKESDYFNSKEADYEFKFIALNGELTLLKKENHELKKNFTYESNKAANLEKSFSDKNEALRHEIRNLIDELVFTKSKVKRFNIAYWGILIGAIVGFTGFGVTLGNKQFTNEQFAMKDTINSLQKENLLLNDYLKKATLKNYQK